MSSQDGAVATAIYFRSKGRGIGAANLNMVNCSVKGLTPLPDLDEMITQFEEAGFAKTRVQRLIRGSTICGIVAGSSSSLSGGNSL
jgi:hypothetical protein